MTCYATDRGVPKEILRMRRIDVGAAWDMQKCAIEREQMELRRKRRQLRGSL